MHTLLAVALFALACPSDADIAGSVQSVLKALTETKRLDGNRRASIPLADQFIYVRFPTASSKEISETLAKTLDAEWVDQPDGTQLLTRGNALTKRHQSDEDGAFQRSIRQSLDKAPKGYPVTDKSSDLLKYFAGLGLRLSSGYASSLANPSTMTQFPLEALTWEIAHKLGPKWLSAVPSGKMSYYSNMPSGIQQQLPNSVDGSIRRYSEITQHPSVWAMRGQKGFESSFPRFPGIELNKEVRVHLSIYRTYSEFHIRSQSDFGGPYQLESAEVRFKATPSSDESDQSDLRKTLYRQRLLSTPELDSLDKILTIDTSRVPRVLITKHVSDISRNPVTVDPLLSLAHSLADTLVVHLKAGNVVIYPTDTWLTAHAQASKSGYPTMGEFLDVLSSGSPARISRVGDTATIGPAYPLLSERVRVSRKMLQAYAKEMDLGTEEGRSNYVRAIAALEYSEQVRFFNAFRKILSTEFRILTMPPYLTFARFVGSLPPDQYERLRSPEGLTVVLNNARMNARLIDFLEDYFIVYGKADAEGRPLVLHAVTQNPRNLGRSCLFRLHISNGTVYSYPIEVLKERLPGNHAFEIGRLIDWLTPGYLQNGESALDHELYFGRASIGTFRVDAGESEQFTIQGGTLTDWDQNVKRVNELPGEILKSILDELKRRKP